jgi:hypothetical protein
MPAEAIRVNSANRDEKRERDRTDGNDCNHLLREAKLPAEETVDRCTS